MKIQEIKYNLYLIDFAEVEKEILYQLKAELDRHGVLSYEDLPKTDYLKLVNYFTLFCVCKSYKNLQHKRNTIYYVETTRTNPDVLRFVKDIKKFFPLLIYITTDQFTKEDNAVYTEITLKLKEFRYSFDYSKYSFNKIKKFCIKNKLEGLIIDFKP